jgi:hypothetical protein
MSLPSRIYLALIWWDGLCGATPDTSFFVYKVPKRLFLPYHTRLTEENVSSLASSHTHHSLYCPWRDGICDHLGTPSASTRGKDYVDHDEDAYGGKMESRKTMPWLYL